MRAILSGLFLTLLAVAISAQDVELNLNFAGMIKGVSLSSDPAPGLDSGFVFRENIYIEPSDPNTILGKIAATDYYLNTLSRWIARANLIGAYSGSPITVFIPSVATLQSLGVDRIRLYDLPENAGRLSELLKNFVVKGRYKSTDLTEGQVLTTLQGQTLVYSSGKINGATISQVDIMATNGVLHVVNGFLEPLDIVSVLAARGHTILVSLLQQSGLAAALPLNQYFTFFAPTDAALAPHLPGLSGLAGDLPRFRATLLHHITRGRVFYNQFRNGTLIASLEQGQFQHIIVKNCGTYVDGTKITTPNLYALNGLIHIIDGPFPLWDVLTVAGDLGHTTFVTAVNAAGLAPLFRTVCGRTVFIPTNAAFAALPAGQLNSLLLPANIKQLQDILYFHVVPQEELYASRISNMSALTLSNGQKLGLRTSVSGIFVNFNVRVGMNSLVTSTAVGHVIPSVLVPRTIAQILGDSSFFDLSLASSFFSALRPIVNATQITFFAPLASLSSLTDAQRAKLLTDPAAQVAAFNFHVLPAVSHSTAWRNGTVLVTNGGVPLTVTIPAGEYPVVGASPVLGVDFVATDGVVHFVSSLVALPPGL